MELIPLLCLLFGATSAQEIRYVNVPEGDDALLPCTLNSGHSIDKFDWRKDNEEDEKLEVFLYESGSYYGHGLTGQSKDFEKRVKFFKDELKSGNASIVIRNTNLDDRGTYTCGLVEAHGRVPIRLNVGAARVPYIRTIRDKITWRLLECNSKGAPEPEVEWRNSAGEVLEKHSPKSDELSNVELKINVTKSDNYTCVATQWKIYHQINYTTEVSIPEIVAVSEGDDAVLPCSLDSKENLQSQEFSWRKDDKEAFFYNSGKVEVDDRFTRRLTHFQHELEKSGNASIRIDNVQKTDGGRYSCHSPHIQKSLVILQVVENPGMVITVPALISIIIFPLVIGLITGLTLAHLRQLKRRCLNRGQNEPAKLEGEALGENCDEEHADLNTMEKT